LVPWLQTFSFSFHLLQTALLLFCTPRKSQKSAFRHFCADLEDTRFFQKLIGDTKSSRHTHHLSGKAARVFTIALHKGCSGMQDSSGARRCGELFL